jgi:hypothetical protein
MADDITSLVFEIEHKGAKELERSLTNIEAGIGNTLKQYKNFSKASQGAHADFGKQVTGMARTMKDLQDGLHQAGKKYAGVFTGPQVRRQEQRLAKMRNELEGLMMTTAQGGEAQKKLARDRINDLQKAIDLEVSATGKLFQKHKEEFDRLVHTEKKTLAGLTKEALMGGTHALSALRSGDVAGMGSVLQRGVGAVGEQAEKRAFDAQATGAANKQMMAMLGSISKMAVAIGAVIGPLALLVKMFLDMDSRAKELNRSMLQNVSITELVGSTYRGTGDDINVARVALEEFRSTALRDMDLRMLGLDPQEMGALLNTMHQQGLLLSDLQEQGVAYGTALERAQIAALNMGVDASETMGFLGQMADITGASFDSAVESLTHIVTSSRQAGVSTQRFFNVVQSVVGEMGLYNFRIEETANLFERLSQIMDSKNAEAFTQELATAFKNASALERTQTVIVTGLARVAEMADRTQQSIADSFDMDHMREAFARIRQLDLFEEMGFEEAMTKLSASQRNELQSTLRRVDQETARQFERYRRILEAGRQDALAMQGVLADFGVGDQISLQIQQLEKTLKMPLERINSVVAESQGISEAQLRMMKSLKTDLDGDLQALRAAAEEAETEEAFMKAAEELGYTMTQEQAASLRTFDDLLRFMTEERADSLSDDMDKQKTLAEESASLQRTLVDTVKYQLIDLVSGIYETLLDVYNAISRLSPFGGTDEATRRRMADIRENLRAQSRLRDLDRQLGGATTPAEQERIQKLIEAEQRAVSRRSDQMSLEDAGISGRGARLATATGMDAIEAKHSEDLQRLAQMQVMYSPKAGTRGMPTWGSPADMEEMLGKGFEITRVSEGTGEGGLATLGGLVRGEDGSLLRGEEAAEFVKRSLESLENRASVAERLEKETHRILEERGISIQDGDINQIANAIVDAQAFAEVQRRIATDLGMGMIDSREAIRAIMTGDDDHFRSMVEAGRAHRGVPDALKKMGIQKAFDARMVTSGIPLLDLQPGDVIVDQDALAQTITGGPGSLIPDLLTRAGIGGGAGGNMMHANFHIYGGDANQVRDMILRTLREWEHKRTMS